MVKSPGPTQIVIHSDTNVRAQSYQFVGSKDLQWMTEELYEKQCLWCSSD